MGNIIWFGELNTDNDHVHILMEIPPKYAVSKVVQGLKSRSSKHLRKKFPFIKKMSGDSAVWAIVFFMSIVGLNEENIRKYIEKQRDQDKPIDVTVKLS